MKSEQSCLFFNQFEATPTVLRAFIRAWHRMLARTACFPGGTWHWIWRRTIFSRAWHGLHFLYIDDFILLLCRSDVVSFAFSFITSVKQDRSCYLTANLTSWKNSISCLAFHSYWLVTYIVVPRCCYSFHLDLHQEKVGMLFVSRF